MGADVLNDKMDPTKQWKQIDKNNKRTPINIEVPYCHVFLQPLSFTSHLFNQFFLTVCEMVWKFHVVGDDEVAEGAIATVVTLAT